MKSNANKAVTLFGLSFAGFAACIGLAFIAGGADPKTDEHLDLKLETSKEQAVEPSPTQAAKSPQAAGPITTPAAQLDPESVQKGKVAYDMYCLACHGPEGTTVNSPSNLFDSKWHHGSGKEGIGKSIRTGIMEKGMPGWEAMISPEEIEALVDYLLSFQNT